MPNHFPTFKVGLRSTLSSSRASEEKKNNHAHPRHSIQLPIFSVALPGFVLRKSEIFFLAFNPLRCSPNIISLLLHPALTFQSVSRATYRWFFVAERTRE